jgi:ABC-2 type transport system ATP-binding protein
VSETYISVENVSMTFGAVRALDDVSLVIGQGEIFGLIGSDGAGKSTLLRLLATMMKPASGKMKIAGIDVVSQSREIKNIIGYMPQRFGLYQDLTVEENMMFFMDIFGVRGAERKVRMEKYLGFSNLLPYLKRPAGKLSGGMKQKLGLACVLVHEPDVLILDEPTNGVDPVSRKEFWDILLDMKAQGKTITVSTAYLDEGELCGRVALMHKSKVIRTGSPDEISHGHKNLEDAMIEILSAADEELKSDTFKR